MKIKVSEISHHPQNEEIYLLSDVDDLVQSINEVGLLQPLVINQHNQVVSGNRRFSAIQKLSWSEVEVEQVEISDEEVGKYLVHYNKFRVKKFRELLNEYEILKKFYTGKAGRPSKESSYTKHNIGNLRDSAASELNLSSSQIQRLLVIQKEDDELIDAIDKEILTVRQAYFQVTRLKKERESRSNKAEKQVENSSVFSFHQRSSDNMIELNDSEVNLCFTSPPYWNKRKYDDEDGWLGNEKTSNEYVTNLIKHFKDTHRVLSDKGSFFLNIGDTFHNGNLQNIPHKVAIGLQDDGWILRNTIIWKKTNPKPSSSKTNLTSSYEFIFHLVKTMDYEYEHTLAELNEKAKSSMKFHLPPRHREVELKDVAKLSMSPYIMRDGKNMGDYWTEDTVQSSISNQHRDTTIEHPATFPEKIVVLPLLQTTNEGDLVLDTFHGSGTTGKVANEYNRNYVGYDLKHY
ncbi:DNA methyltransferase [Candidatus Pseudothioglobus singularis]|nr:DNA methyltransferase [Candidatus Pseudothioglobus singularis]